MPKTAVIKSHTSSKRDSWWYLHQDDDGTLYVTHKDDDDPDKGTTRWTLEDALKKRIASPQLQQLVDRMFEDRDA